MSNKIYKHEFIKFRELNTHEWSMRTFVNFNGWRIKWLCITPIILFIDL